MKTMNTLKLLLLSLGLAVQGMALAVTIEGPVSWGAQANTAIGNCTPACNGIVADGDISATSATSSLVYPFGSPPDEAFAQATLSGTSFTPLLKARADSTSRAVEAFATGIQGYTNTGAARTIVLDLLLSANVTPGSGGSTNATAQVGVFLTDALSAFSTDFGAQREFDGDKLVGADTPNDASDDGRARLSVSGVNGYATPVSATISFFVEAGQDFLIWAGLEAQARNGGTADATNTFTIDLLEEDGSPIDAALLDVASQGAVGVVPLPAGVWLFLSGIGLIAGLSRRRRALQAG